MTLVTLLASIHGQRLWSQAAIECSQIVQGRLGIADLKEFTFAASAGDTVSIIVPDVFAAVFDLFGSDRQIVNDAEGNPIENRNSLGGDGLTLPVTGTYTIRVHDEFFNDVRDFALSLECLFPLQKQCPDGPALACNQTVSGRVELSESKIFNFDGAAGDTISLILPDVYGSVFDLFDPSGQIVKDANGNPIRNWNILAGSGLSLPVTGNYTIRVHDEFFNDVREFVLTIKWLFHAPLPEAHFIRGDSDRNFCVDLTDAIYTLNFLFLGGPGPACLDAADADDSGKVDLTDAVHTLSFLFLGGPAPLTPFPASGTDPTADELGCVCE